MTENRATLPRISALPWITQKHSAEMATSRVEGVKAVAEELDVRLPFSVKRNDEDFARAVVDRLGWVASVPHKTIKLKVETGWVNLSVQGR